MKTKPITKKQFLADVMHEIEMLKLHATDSEKSKLDFKSFDPFYPEQCVYGQMTGSCESERAKDLIEQCCIRMMDFGDKDIGSVNKDNFTNISKYINGEIRIDDMFSDEYSWGRDYTYLSSLEGYINIGDAKNKQIIQYIKGEIPTLTL